MMQRRGGSLDKRLVRALIDRGADKLEHSGRTLIEHLIGTADRLARRRAPTDLVHAGLFHAVYGTAKFTPNFAHVWTRDELVTLIGARAELFVYLYSRVSREALLATVRPKSGSPVVVPGRAAQERLRLSRETFEALRLLAHANEEDIRANWTKPGAPPGLGVGFFKLTKGAEINGRTRVAMVGIPSDAGSPKPGARFGPRLLREATSALVFRAGSADGLLDLERTRYPLVGDRVVDIGDVDTSSDKLEEQLELVEQVVREVPKHVITFTVGGDHVFTLSALTGRSRPNALLVHIDQHTDCQLWGQFSATGPVKLDRPTHSNFISHVASRMPGIEVLQLGVQAFVGVPSRNEAARNYTLRYLSRMGKRVSNVQLQRCTDDALRRLLPTERDVYISIDCDVLNMAAMPEVAYPAAIGITYERLLFILEELVTNNRVFGCDLMEFGRLSTTRRSAGCRLGAELLARWLGMLLDSEGG